MKYLFVLLLALLCASMADGHLDYSEVDDFSLSSCVEDSEVVVIGTVSTLNSVWRENTTARGHGAIVTEVVVSVSDFIKGTGNLGPDHVKFIVLGGIAFVPSENAVMRYDVHPEPKFKLNEKVLLFLDNDSDDPGFVNYPYGKTRVHYSEYGKKLVVDDKVHFVYPKDGEPAGLGLDLDLAKNLGKACVADKDAALLIENRIKSEFQSKDIFTLTDALTNELNDRAKLLLEEK